MFEVLVSFLSSFRVYFRTQSDNQLEIVPTENSISCSIFSIHKSKNVSWNVRRIIGSTFTELGNDLVEHCLVQS